MTNNQAHILLVEGALRGLIAILRDPSRHYPDGIAVYDQEIQLYEDLLEGLHTPTKKAPMSLTELEKNAVRKPLEAELDRQKEKAALYKKKFHALLDEIEQLYEEYKQVENEEEIRNVCEKLHPLFKKYVK